MRWGDFMFYKQGVEDIKLVILSLDGGLLDLNRLRYNYFNRICKKYGKNVSKEEFSNHLGNYQTMYAMSPIQSIVSNENLDAIIEKDLYEYAKLKRNIKKEGVDELIRFFKQKNIKIAVLSTHKTKRAIEYLQLTKLYQHIDFVIGGDNQYSILPDPLVLETVCKQMYIPTDKTLVLANFPGLVAAANENLMNVIYLQDLLPANPTITGSVYSVAKNNIEAMDIMLFAKYDTMDMYSPLLHMSKNMDLMTLEKTYQQLLYEYQDDPGLLELVRKTYQYYLIEINDSNVRNQEMGNMNLDYSNAIQSQRQAISRTPEPLEKPTDFDARWQDSDEDDDYLVNMMGFDEESTSMDSTGKTDQYLNHLLDKINANANLDTVTNYQSPFAQKKEPMQSLEMDPNQAFLDEPVGMPVFKDRQDTTVEKTGIATPIQPYKEKTFLQETAYNQKAEMPVKETSETLEEQRYGKMAEFVKNIKEKKKENSPIEVKSKYSMNYPNEDVNTEKDVEMDFDSIYEDASLQEVSGANETFVHEEPPVEKALEKKEKRKKEKQKKEKKVKEKPIKEDSEEDTESTFIDKLLDFLYTVSITFITSFVAILLYLVAEDFIQGKGVISNIIRSIIDFYVMIVRSIYGGIFNGLHSFVDFIPTYQELMKGNDLLSSMGIEVIMFVIFNVCVVYIIRGIYHLLGRFGLGEE